MVTHANPGNNTRVATHWTSVCRVRLTPDLPDLSWPEIRFIGIVVASRVVGRSQSTLETVGRYQNLESDGSRVKNVTSPSAKGGSGFGDAGPENPGHSPADSGSE